MCINPFGCPLNQNSSSDLLSAIVHTADAGSLTHGCITSVLLASRPETEVFRADQSTKSQHGSPGKQRHRDCKAEAKSETTNESSSIGSGEPNVNQNLN